ASGQVGHLDRGDRRRTSIRSDSVQQTGYGRVIDVVARPGSHRAMLAVSGEGTVDQAGMDLAERLRIQAEPGHHARPEALHHHVHLRYQAMKDLSSRLRLHVE